MIREYIGDSFKEGWVSIAIYSKKITLVNSK